MIAFTSKLIGRIFETNGGVFALLSVVDEDENETQIILDYDGAADIIGFLVGYCDAVDERLQTVSDFE